MVTTISTDATSGSFKTRWRILLSTTCRACSSVRPDAIITINELQKLNEIITLSISVSVAATVVATVISLPLGTTLAVSPFRGRRMVIVLINAFFGLPPVVVGLILYLTLSRSGPLGSFALLFTPTAMVIAQTILAIPIITALVHRANERAWARYGDELITDGATRVHDRSRRPSDCHLGGLRSHHL
jgi:ABC-type tungstate transport system substrate-binding protein